MNRPIFSGLVQGLEIRAETGAIIEMSGRHPQFLSIGQTGSLVLRVGNKERRFRLRNSSLSFHRSRCVVLAEEILEVREASLVGEC